MNKRFTLTGKMIAAIFLLFMGLGSVSAAKVPLAVDELQKLDKQSTLQDVQKAFTKYFDSMTMQRKPGWKQYKRWEYFWAKRLTEGEPFPNMVKIYDEVNQFESSQKGAFNKTLSADWLLMGPVDIPEATGDAREQGIGRINIVRFHPTNANEIWVGAASGGVWKTMDGGKTWITFPFTNFMTVAVSDIAISKTNPNVVYVATGDADGTPSSGGAFYSIGIIKTTDGGATWGTTEITKELSNSYIISRLLVDPANENIVLAAAQDGIFKSTNGGTSWTKKQSGNFKDMEFKPDDPNIVYSSVFGSWGGLSTIWKSSNKGDTWKQINIGNDLKGSDRIALEVVDNPSYYNNVYALVSSSTDHMFHSFWFSDDAGESYEIIANRESVGNILGRYTGSNDDIDNGQGWYDLCLAINPTNPKLIYSGAINIWNSKDDGNGWERLTHWQIDPKLPYVHADHHDLKFQPGTNVLFSANDGGISKLENGNWVDLTAGISITQFYRIGLSQSESNVVIGGAQDNGTSMLRNGKWTHVYAGDGMDCAIDPKDPKKFYVSVYNGTFFRTTDGGSSFTATIYPGKTSEDGNWVTPFIIDPSNPAVLYAGYKSVWRSSNYGATWNKLSPNTLSSQGLDVIAVSPSDPNTLYAANSGSIFKTKNLTSWASIPSAPAGSISSIAVDPANPDRIFVTLSNYTNNRKVFVYEPSTSTWTNLSGNLPNIPVSSIVYQKDSPDRIYIGTDIGVYYSDHGSANWTRYGKGMPNIIVEDLEIHQSDKKLYAGTYSRGVWQIDLLDCELAAPTVAVTGNLTFCQGDSVVLTAQDGYASYLWSTGETTKTITVKETGEYKVTGFDDKDCSATSAGVIVTRKSVPLPKIIVTGSKFPLCEGDTDTINYTFTATFGFQSYLWNTGSTERKITITKEGEYFFTGTTSDGCSVKSDIFYVKYHPIPAKPAITQEWLILKSTPAKTYQWYLDDQKIDGATEQTYLVKKIGKYNVEITDSNTCSNISDPHQVTTDVREPSENNVVKIHPNPSSGVFSVEMYLNASSPLEITVRNIIGQQMLSRTYTDRNGLFLEKFDLTDLAPGVYFFDVKYNGKLYVIKAVKD